MKWRSPQRPDPVDPGYLVYDGVEFPIKSWSVGDGKINFRCMDKSAPRDLPSRGIMEWYGPDRTRVHQHDVDFNAVARAGDIVTLSYSVEMHDTGFKHETWVLGMGER